MHKRNANRFKRVAIVHKRGGGEHADHGMRGNESDEKARDPEGDPGKEKKKGQVKPGSPLSIDDGPECSPDDALLVRLWQSCAGSTSDGN